MKGYNHGKLITKETRLKMATASHRTRNGFKKGHPSFLEHHSVETRKRLSDFSKKIGRMPPGMKGKKHSPETILKLKKSHLGNSSGAGNKGRVTSLAVRLKISRALKGEKGPGWKGGVTPANQIVRTSIETSLWRESVFARDNWTCQKTGIKGGRLHAHHVRNFASSPELRFAIDNGITLSQESHREFHRRYGLRNNTPEQLREFLVSE